MSDREVGEREGDSSGELWMMAFEAVLLPRETAPSWLCGASLFATFRSGHTAIRVSPDPSSSLLYSTELEFGFTSAHAIYSHVKRVVYPIPNVPSPPAKCEQDWDPLLRDKTNLRINASGYAYMNTVRLTARPNYLEAFTSTNSG